MSEEITESLKPLFTKARTENLWFFSPYQEVWFSPDELEKQQRAGKFLWGSVNWKLRDPSERLKELDIKIKSAEAEKARFEFRIIAA